MEEEEREGVTKQTKEETENPSFPGPELSHSVRFPLPSLSADTMATKKMCDDLEPLLKFFATIPLSSFPKPQVRPLPKHLKQDAVFLFPFRTYSNSFSTCVAPRLETPPTRTPRVASSKRLRTPSSVMLWQLCASTCSFVFAARCPREPKHAPKLFLLLLDSPLCKCQQVQYFFVPSSPERRGQVGQ